MSLRGVAVVDDKPKNVDLVRLRGQIALGLGWFDGAENYAGTRGPGWQIVREALVDAWNTCTYAINDGKFAPDKEG